MPLLGEQAITSSEKSHYLFLKAVFACNIDSKISHKGIDSGRFSNRNCGMEEGAASSLADTDEVDNLTNGGLLLALKASKLYFGPVVSKHQKSSLSNLYSFHDARITPKSLHMLRKFSATELYFLFLKFNDDTKCS